MSNLCVIFFSGVRTFAKDDHSPAKTSTVHPTMTQPTSMPAPVHKVIMVGAGGVGKSALTLQFMYEEVWNTTFCFFFFFFFFLLSFQPSKLIKQQPNPPPHSPHFSHFTKSDCSFCKLINCNQIQFQIGNDYL